MTTGRHDHDRRGFTSHEQWDELAVGYALSALEPDELDAFVQHLVAFCPECSQSVSDTNEVGASLAAALPMPEPRETLRNDVLQAALASRPALPQTSADLPVEATVPPAVTAFNPVASAPIDELAARRARRFNPARAGWVLAAAAAVVAVVMSIVTVSALHSRDNQQTVADSYSSLIKQVTAESGRVVPLRADGGATVATVFATKQSVTVVPAGIAANSKATSYVLWGIASATSAPVALGDFDVTGSSKTATQVGTDSRGYGTFTSFAISHEPGHTPPASPSQIVATGQA